MEKSKLSRYIIIGLVLVNISMLIFLVARSGSPHGPRGPHGKGGPKQMIIDRLNLDANQQKEYDKMVEKHQSQLFKLNDDSKVMHDELYSLLKADTLDQQKANRIISKITANQAALENLNMAHFAEIKSICRPEQLPSFMNLVDELGEMFHKGPPPPPRR